MAKAKIGIMHLQAKEHQRLLASHQNWERGKWGFLYRFQGKHSRVNNLISDVEAPEPWDNKYPLF